MDRPEGGLFIWATLPDYIDTGDLLAKALRENVAFVPGQAAYVDGRAPSSMRLNFSASKPRTRSARASAASARSCGEQVELYETMTGERRSSGRGPRPSPRRRAEAGAPTCCRCGGARRSGGES